MPFSSSLPATDLASAFIGAAITPALLFTACALLLSGLQGKYSTLVHAIRNLNIERRALHEERHNDSPPWAPARRENLERQVAALMERARLVRNSLFCLYSGIFLMLLASLCGGVSALGVGIAAFGALGLFAAGMLCVVTAMVFGFQEARRAFEIILLEAASGEAWDEDGEDCSNDDEDEL
jgi:hypothetical protein